MKHSGAHEFAIFIDTVFVGEFNQKKSLIISDHDTINRIVTILRLKIGRLITFFTEKEIFFCVLEEINKKRVICSVIRYKEIEKTLPAMNIAIPLLERDALEEVVYMATVYAVQNIHLVITEKSRASLYEKDINRLYAVSRAAREQSKQFYKPLIHTPVLLDVFLYKELFYYENYQKLWCDIKGAPLLEHRLIAEQYQGSCLIMGPEGDFTDKEKESLASFFTPVALTNSVLRACDAAALIMGVMRL